MQLSSIPNLPTLSAPARDRYSLREYTLRIIAYAGLLILGAAALLHYGPALLALLRDQTTLQRFIHNIGWWGPAVLIAVNVLQIVIAPIPGYAVYLAAGFLYGVWWGGVWGSLGLLAGGMAAIHLDKKIAKQVLRRPALVEIMADAADHRVRGGEWAGAQLARRVGCHDGPHHIPVARVHGAGKADERAADVTFGKQCRQIGHQAVISVTTP